MHQPRRTLSSCDCGSQTSFTLVPRRFDSRITRMARIQESWSARPVTHASSVQVPAASQPPGLSANSANDSNSKIRGARAAGVLFAAARRKSRNPVRCSTLNLQRQTFNLQAASPPALAAPGPDPRAQTPDPNSPVQRTPDSQPRFLHHVRVDLRRRHVLVSEEFLNGSDVITAFQKMRGDDCHKTFNVQRSTLNLECWKLLGWPCEC
jgi:hypothetical protein